MATTTTLPAETIGQKIEHWLPLVESLANAGLTISGLAPIAALLGAVEPSINNLFTAIANKSTTQNDIMAGWAAAIALWTAIGNQANMDATVKARVNEYIASAQQALAGYYLAQQGFDAAIYAPVTPIA